ncbi:MAG: NAD(P)-binding protein, partial [Firmicutes bacterium]|nr:NAD(P)-binding protein [Bacillota bacterium]
MTKEKKPVIIERDPNPDDYTEIFENCLMKEPPYCVAACPFDAPLKDMFDKMGRASFNAAFKPYRDAVCFPDIVSSLCPEYCKGGCPRNDTDSAVEIRLLERSLVLKAKKKEPRKMNLPKKDGKVAIIGAGPSGMAMAQRMATRKYDVEIFEKTDRIGGHLWGLLSPEVFVKDIERQLMHEEYQLHLNTEITDLGELISQGFNSIYVATGEGGNDFGVIENAIEQEDGTKWYFRAEGDVGIFAGGSLLGMDTMHAIADGLNIAHALQGWMQVKHLDYPIHAKDTNIQLVGREWDPAPAVKPTEAFTNDAGEEEILLSEEEVAAEISRCLSCQCDGCMKYCDLSAFYDKWPLQIKREINGTIMEGESLLHGKPAKRLINTCTMCGLCEDVCPEDIDIGPVALMARRVLHRQGKMIFAMHQFFLNDMDHANGPLANIVKDPPVTIGKPETKASKYAFFPGCQIGAADPELVTGAYSYILQHEPETGLMLGCCGVPAEWSGDPDRLDAENERIRSEWESLGKPELILACATCAKQFDKFFPDIKYRFLYDLMAEWGTDFASKGDGKREFAIFDPCSTRGRDDLRDSVRDVIAGAGYALEPLERQEKHSACCSFGGQGSDANPPFTEFVRKRRIEESEDPYICYCINCRDAFIEEG